MEADIDAPSWTRCQLIVVERIKEREKELEGSRKKSKGHSTSGKHDGMQHDRHPFRKRPFLGFSNCLARLFHPVYLGPSLVMLQDGPLAQCISQVSVQLYSG